MGSLTGSMLIAANALLVQQGALDATSNNIANSNTPGYSREIPILTEAAPVVESNVTYGQGVTLQQIASVRDTLLQLRLYDETQQQNNADTQVNYLQQVENLFSNTDQGIGTDITAFFNSLNQLSTDPGSVSQRQSVLAAANNLANDFHGTVSQLTGIQQNLNQNVVQNVNQINILTGEIAKLNAQVADMHSMGQDGGSVEDQRDQLITQLSALTDVSAIQTAQGLTLTTGNGTPLVVGNQSFALQASLDSTGAEQVYSQGQNFTTSIQGGQLGGLLTVRDQFLPKVFDSLNSLASGLAANFNAAHAQGYDLSGNPGQAFFSDTTGSSAAADFSVAITDPSLIAASSDGSSGSNGNIALLEAVQNQQLPSGQKPLDSYSGIVFSVGSATAQAQSASQASALAVQQVTNQIASVSGVSLDEETTNLIRYQHAFQAAARVITTVDELTQTVLSMGSPTG